ncbi:acetoacetate decarboxylase family protein [Streptomyces sp. enrichment culture]|uniref:acetoacetate decarboxylase family protein n=1 Tax=Streptomyces sp. enrichment culture TaxID=1795815 RepID=UPI003F549326
MTATSPPPPWHLRGTLHAALWGVRADRLPSWTLPPGVRPLRLGRRRAVVTFWVDYRPGGTLVYRELLVALAVRGGRSVGACAVEAWVDDPRSLAGGRSLWGIPKDPAEFTFDHPAPALLTTTVRTSRPAPPHPRPAASPVTALHRPLVRLPGRLRVRARLFQPALPERPYPCEVPLSLTGTAWLTRTRLRTAPGAPLGYLTGLRPLAACSLRDFRFTIAPAEPSRTA